MLYKTDAIELLDSSKNVDHLIDPLSSDMFCDTVGGDKSVNCLFTDEISDFVAPFQVAGTELLLK